MAAPKTIVQLQSVDQFGRTMKTTDPRARATTLTGVKEARRRFSRWGTRPPAPTR